MTVAQLEKPDYRLLMDWALVDDCLNRSDAAMQKYQQAAALEKTAHVYSQIARIHAKAGRIAPALEALATAQALDPTFEGRNVVTTRLAFVGLVFCVARARRCLPCYLCKTYMCMMFL